MRTVVQGFGASAIPAVAGAVALGGGILAMADKAVQGVAATQRFSTALGQFAKDVDTIHVGTLNIGLDQLSVKMGTVPSATRQAAATIFQFAQNAGIAGPAAAQFTSEVVALAARAVALNPALGSIADVIPLMSRGLATGGRFAQRFQLELTSAEIATRALADTGKTLTSELTVTEKQMAGAEIAAAKYGGVIGKQVADGAKNATLQQRSFRAEIEHTIEVLARPLVAPFFTAIESGIPAIEALGKVLASLAVSAFPAIIQAIQIVTPILTVMAEVFQTLGPLITVALDAFIAFKVIGPIVQIFSNINTALLGAAASYAAAGDAATAASLQVEASNVAFAGSVVGLVAVGAAAIAGALSLGAFSDDTKRATVNTQALGKASTDAGVAILETVAAENAVIDVFKNGGSQQVARHTELLKELKTAADDNIGTATRLGQALVAAGDITQGQFNSIIHDAARGQQQLATDTQNATTSLEVQQQTISDLATSIQTTVPTMGGQFHTFASAVSSAFKGATPTIDQFAANLTATAQQVGAWQAQIHYLLLRGFTGMAALVESQGPHVGLQLAHQFDKEAPGVQQAQDHVFKTMNDSLQKSKTSNDAAVKAIATGVVEALDGPAKDGRASKTGQSIGSQFIRGIATGVATGTGVLNSAISQAVAQAVAAAKTAAGIKSPSTVFAEIGVQMVAGMAQGIASVPPPVVSAVAGAGAPGSPDHAGLAAAIAAAIPKAGVAPAQVQVIVVGSMSEARAMVPAAAQDHPVWLNG